MSEEGRKEHKCLFPLVDEHKCHLETDSFLLEITILRIRISISSGLSIVMC